MRTIFECELNFDRLDDCDVDAVCKTALKYHRATIINAIETLCPDLKGEIEKDYEGGIDNWFGPGSVCLCELPLNIRITYNESGTIFELITTLA